MEKSLTTFKINEKRTKFYRIQDLIFYIKSMNKTRSKYIIECDSLNLRSISLPEQELLKRFFSRKKCKFFLRKDEINIQKHLARLIQSQQRFGFEGFKEKVQLKQLCFTDKNFERYTKYKEQEKILKTRATSLQTRKNNSIFFEKEKIYLVMKSYSKLKTFKENEFSNFMPRLMRTDVPIIIVPTSISSIINLTNAKNFFENYQYIPHDRLPKQKVGERIIIKRPSKLYLGETINYEIIDDPTRLPNAEDWNRIVSIISVGKRWQFSRWKKEFNIPQVLFNKCIGFFFYFDDNPLKKNNFEVLNWRVKLLAISKTERHNDDQVVVNFWNILNDFLPSHKNKKLLY